MASAASARVGDARSSWATSAGRSAAAAVIASAARSAEASVVLTFVDRAALAQLGEQAAQLVERLRRARGGTSAMPSLARKVSAVVEHAGRRGDELVERQRVDLLRQRGQVVHQRRAAPADAVLTLAAAASASAITAWQARRRGRRRASSSVSWRTEARRGVDVVDRAAGAQVGDQARGARRARR